MRVFLAGMPQPCGGANQEAGDTVLLWRRLGIEVTVLYFMSCACRRPVAQPGVWNPWVDRLRDVGVDFVGVEPGKFGEVSGLSGSTVVSFCCTHALHNWAEFSDSVRNFVWSPTMNYISFSEDHAFSTVCPPTVIHYQSSFQRNRMLPKHQKWGQFRDTMIHGAFEPLAWNPRPRGGQYVVGRLSRPDPSKWNRDWWPALGKVKETVQDMEALCMAWSVGVEVQCGEPPAWARCLGQSALTTQAFLDQCHVLACWNGRAVENWPRVGLEAMSVGVPLVVDDKGGWREMLGEAGAYASSFGQWVNLLKTYGQCESIRQEAIKAGRERLQEIAAPGPIGAAWKDLLGGL